MFGLCVGMGVDEWVWVSGCGQVGGWVGVCALFAQVLHYVATCPQPMHSLPVDLSSSEFNPGAMLGEVTTVHGERESHA